MIRHTSLLLLLLWLTGCSPTAVAQNNPDFPPLATLMSTAVPVPTLVPTLPPLPATYAPTFTPEPTATPLPTLGPPSPTPEPANPYAGLSIAELRQREYGGGQIEAVETLETTEKFTRYLIKYPSDGLEVYGFMNVPNEGTRFPVALVLHGFMPLDSYKTTTYSTRYADALAEAGYFVIHPSYRNHPPSDVGGANLFRVEYALDVLNLIAILQTQGQDATGLLRRADTSTIHALGHSMGGGILQRVMAVRPTWLTTAVLYASMSGDETRNFEKVIVWSEGKNGELELAAPREVVTAVNPWSYLHEWQTPISIHHGTLDRTVPLAWSEELCTRLQTANRPVECHYYQDGPHTFYGNWDDLFIERVLTFFAKY
jgi:uncharacterized protein